MYIANVSKVIRDLQKVSNHLGSRSLRRELRLTPACRIAPSAVSESQLSPEMGTCSTEPDNRTGEQVAKRRKTGKEVPRATFEQANAASYAEQLARKKDFVLELFKDMSIPEMEVHESDMEHHRMRAEFRVWQTADDVFYVMFDKRTTGVRKDGSKVSGMQRVDQYPVASAFINQMMQCVMECVRQNPVLKHKLFQANFHDSLSEEAMVSLVYHAKLEESWREAAEGLQEKLNALRPGHSIGVIGRSKNQKVVRGRDYIVEQMPVSGRVLMYKQVEGAFSQPNGKVCCKMLEWAHSVTRGSSSGDLLELYCGNGNFTIALASNFREVIATEVAKASVAAANYNIEANAVSNVHVARLSAEEFVQAWRGEREFFRMQGMPEVKARTFQTLLVDPPRAGLDEKSVELLQLFDNVVYISCNPVTLHKNILQMGGSHSIQRFALFDQFPYTEHVECGVYLVRKPR